MYALIDSNNIVQNIIVYNGTAQYTPPAGLTLVPIPHGTVLDIGDTYTAS